MANLDPRQAASHDRSPSAMQFRRLVEAVSDCALILLDTQGVVVSWNRGAELIKGYQASEIIGKHFSTFYSAEANAVGHPDSELELARTTGRYEEEGWRVRQDGSLFWASVVIIAMHAADGTLEGFGKYTRDLTTQLQAQQQATNTLTLLRTTVRTDPLTGLYNRRGLDDALKAAIEAKQPFCVAMLDLDEFKTVNDRHGHSAGDRLLQHVTAAWRGVLRPNDLLARYGGDEFALVMPDCSLAEAVAITDRARAATPTGCTCSAGVAPWTPGHSIDDVLGAADANLYQAKNNGRDSVWPKRASVVALDTRRPT
jgi:diguanylate cyclase (GGDEF)-like protein/PAS domain S-box-containing protein